MPVLAKSLSFRRLFGFEEEPVPKPVEVLPRPDVELMVTLWPSFPHYAGFASREGIAGIRLNSAMMELPELDKELSLVEGGVVPNYFDVKGRQLRVTEVLDNKQYLDIRLNHPIAVETPTVVLLKAGADAGRVGTISERGYRLTFDANPRYSVRTGESLHIRDPGLRVGGSLFADAELQKMEKVRQAGFTRWFLSYVEEPRDVEAMREIVGQDAQIMLKIENQRGLRFASRWSPRTFPNTNLVAAFGDLYVEVAKPHHALAAAKTIIEADPRAVAGSRMMLSVIHEEVPSLADFGQLAWLRSLGYARFLLCDELCLRGELLTRAVDAFTAWKRDCT